MAGACLVTMVRCDVAAVEEAACATNTYSSHPLRHIIHAGPLPTLCVTVVSGWC